MGPRIIFLLFLFTANLPLAVWAELSAQNTTVPQQQRQSTATEIINGIEFLYNWNFDRAESIFQKYIKDNPDDPLGYFYNAMVVWSRLASGFWSPEMVKEYKKRVDQTVSIARMKINRNEANSFTYFYMGGALGFQGRLHLMKHEWFQAFRIALRAIESLEKCRELDPNNKDVLLGLGIYEYYTAKLSGLLRFLSYFLIRKGGQEEGLLKLHSAASGAVYASVEAKSVLLHIYLFMESRYEEALPLALDLAHRFEDNPRFSYFLGLVYLNLDKKEDYLSVLRAMNRRGGKIRDRNLALVWKHRALYLEAGSDLFSMRHDRAREKLEMILKEANEKIDPAMSAFPLLKIGMSYDLEGYRNKAIEYYNEVLTMPNGAGAQFLAERYREEPPAKDDPFLGY